MERCALSRAALTGQSQTRGSPQAVKHLERVFGLDSQPIKDLMGEDSKSTRSKFGLALNRIKKIYGLDAASVPKDAMKISLNARGLRPLLRFAVKAVRNGRRKGTTKWTVKVQPDDEPFTIEEEDESGVTFLEAAAQFVMLKRDLRKRGAEP